MGDLDYLNYVHLCQIYGTDTRNLEINIRKRNIWAMSLFINNNFPQKKFEFSKNFLSLGPKANEAWAHLYVKANQVKLLGKDITRPGKQYMDEQS